MAPLSSESHGQHSNPLRTGVSGEQSAGSNARNQPRCTGAEKLESSSAHLATVSNSSVVLNAMAS